MNENGTTARSLRLDRRRRLTEAHDQLWAVLRDERPAFIEIRNHLLNTMVAFEGFDDETIAYLRDLGQSVHNLILAIDLVDIVERGGGRAELLREEGGG